MLDSIDDKIEQSVNALELSVEAQKPVKIIRPLLENLIRELSKKLVLNLNEIKEENIDLDEKKLEFLQKEEVEKYKETIAYFAHYVDKNVKDKK